MDNPENGVGCGDDRNGEKARKGVSENEGEQHQT